MIPPAWIALHIGWITILLVGGVSIEIGRPVPAWMIVHLASWAAVIVGIAALISARKG